MRIQKDMQICGLPVSALRRFLRGLVPFGGFDTQDLQRELGLDEALATSAIAELLKEGYICRHPDSDGRHEWGVNLKLGALAAASFTKPISRKRLEELLQGVIDRAEENNANPARAAEVVSISIFGSYWRNQNDYGDLDLVVETRVNEEWLAVNWAMAWNLNPRHDLVRALAARRPHISITDMPPKGADLRRVWSKGYGRLKRPARISPKA